MAEREGITEWKACTDRMTQDNAAKCPLAERCYRTGEPARAYRAKSWPNSYYMYVDI